MNDTRLTWITNFSSDPEKIAIAFPKGSKADVLQTLRDRCGGIGQAKIVQENNLSNSFSPIPQTQLNDLGCDVVLYLLRSKESFKSIKQKINKSGSHCVEEYTVFPGWENPRWFVPRKRSLGFGKMSRMIQPSRLVAKIAVAAFRFLKAIGGENYFFRCRIIVAHNSKNTFLNFFKILGEDTKTGIVYTGSFGPLQKFTVELLKDACAPFAYAKFGHNDYAKRAIQNERVGLEKIAELPLMKMRWPELLECELPEMLVGQALIVKTLKGGCPQKYLTDIVIEGLVELFLATQEINKVSLKSYITNQVKTLQERNCSHIEKEYKKMRDEVVYILQNIINSHIDDTIMLPLALSHGDFTRWNLMADNARIYVVDWEEASLRPAGHDLLSFKLSEFRVRLSPEKTAEMMFRVIKNDFFTNYLTLIDLDEEIMAEYLGVMFFADSINSCLKHAESHQRFNYPIKTELFDIARTSYLGIRWLSNDMQIP